MNRTAHHQIAMRTQIALKELANNPSMLKRRVKEHRMSHEDIAACTAHQKTSLSAVIYAYQSWL